MNSEFRIQLHCVEIHVVLGRVVSTYDLRFAGHGCGCLKRGDESRILCDHAMHDAKKIECKFVLSLNLRCISAGDWFLETWLILPVVICLSQRLSHACLSISIIIAKLRMAH